MYTPFYVVFIQQCSLTLNYFLNYISIFDFDRDIKKYLILE